MQVKTCTKCQGTLTINYFHKQKKGKYGVSSICKDCKLEYNQTPKRKKQRARYRKSKLGKANRKREIVKRHGLTLEQYDKMFENQNRVCAICDGINPSGNRLHVDHNHKTNKVRKLLCTRCNILIGYLEKDDEIARKAQKYLKAHQE